MPPSRVFKLTSWFVDFPKLFDYLQVVEYALARKSHAPVLEICQRESKSGYGFVRQRGYIGGGGTGKSVRRGFTRETRETFAARGIDKGGGERTRKEEDGGE